MKYNDIRRETRIVKIGNKTVGGKSPILIQSMTNTDTHDISATIKQIKALKRLLMNVAFHQLITLA